MTTMLVKLQIDLIIFFELITWISQSRLKMSNLQVTVASGTKWPKISEVSFWSIIISFSSFQWTRVACRPFAATGKVKSDRLRPWSVRFHYFHLFFIVPVNSCGALPVRGDWEGAVQSPQICDVLVFIISIFLFFILHSSKLMRRAARSRRLGRHSSIASGSDLWHIKFHDFHLLILYCLLFIPVNSCGVLPVRGDWEGAVRSPQTYMAGQSIKVNCKSGYNFWGQDTWKCNYDGNWEGYTWGREEEWPMCMSKYVCTCACLKSRVWEWMRNLRGLHLGRGQTIAHLHLSKYMRKCECAWRNCEGD